MPEVESPDPHMQSADMANESEILRKWLEKGMSKPGKTQAECARHLGYSSHTSVLKMIKGGLQIKARHLPLISSYIEEPIPPQFVAKHKLPNSDESVFLVGKIDSSSWRDAAVGRPGAQVDIPKYRTDPYIFVKQEAYLVDDDFSEPFAKRGDYVITVDYEAVGLLPQHDDIVVTLEARVLDGDRLVRISLRRVVESRGKLFAAPFSGAGDGVLIEAVTLRYVLYKATVVARRPRL